MRRTSPKELIRCPTAQYRHVRQRFQERYALTLTINDVNEVKQKIVEGHSVCLTERSRIRTCHLIEAGGRLVPVIYDRRLQQLITVLPEEELSKVAPDVLGSARLRLLSNGEARVSNEIRAVQEQTPDVTSDPTGCHFPLEEDSVGAGYWPGTASSSGSPHTPSNAAAVEFPPLLDLPDSVAASYRQQIITGQARFLWRYTKRLKFFEVRTAAGRLWLGYHRRTKLFYAYREPPETMAELCSSLRLFAQPEEVLEMVARRTLEGQVNILERGTFEDRCEIEINGEQFVFLYSASRDRIEVYVPPPRHETASARQKYCEMPGATSE